MILPASSSDSDSELDGLYVNVFDSGGDNSDESMSFRSSTAVESRPTCATCSISGSDTSGSTTSRSAFLSNSRSSLMLGSSSSACSTLPARSSFLHRFSSIDES